MCFDFSLYLCLLLLLADACILHFPNYFRDNVLFCAVIVEMRGQYGYLSAIEWPLLPVSSVSYIWFPFV